jgi:acyl-CoA thioester hydrolase
MARPVNAEAALETGGRNVPADWIDYNGHMMDAYYSVAFTEATEMLLDHVGLGAAYRARTGSGIYTVESHICFRVSVRGGERLRYTSRLLGSDSRRLHVFHQILLPSGTEAATNELMFLHVDLASEGVTDMPPEQLAAVSALAARHAMLPVPAAAGRSITLRRPG